MATVEIPVTVKQALGAALVEVLTGNLTDETIAMVATIRASEVPANLRDIVRSIQGMSLSPTVRESASQNTLGELFTAAQDAHWAHFKS